jgi:sugar O-acyltransferase (sialic acid O-acetyltransferase NeuD family)
MAKLIIFGAFDQARLAEYYFRTDSGHEPVAFTVDRDYMPAEGFFRGLPVVPFEEVQQHYPPAEYQMFIALSYAKMNRIREQKYHDAKEKGYTLASYISSRCSLLTDYSIGDNALILEDNTIQPFVRIGNNVTLWSGNHIGHDSVIEDHNFISSHVVVSGHCHIYSNCFLGVNATLHNNVVIAPGTLLAAGATIAKETEEKGVYMPPQSTRYRKNSDEINF